MANLQRQRRVADHIRRELAEIIRMELKDPRVGMLTLTDVEMSSDLSHAKVFFTMLADGEVREETGRGLKRAAGFLRTMLGRRLDIRVTPELHFAYDSSVEEGVRLSRLIDEALLPPVPPPPPSKPARKRAVKSTTSADAKPSKGAAAKPAIKRARKTPSK